MTSDDLLALLSPEQQAAFNATLQDPHKFTALVSEEFEEETPWWSSTQDAIEDENAGLAAPSRPPLVESALLPPIKINSDGQIVVDSKLLYNIVAVLFAYAYTLRTFSLASFASLHTNSTERTAAAEVMAQLVPFLVEQSTLVLSDVNSAVEYVLAREEPDVITPQLFTLLLRDVAEILRPSAVAELSSLRADSQDLLSHPSASPLAALSDVQGLFNCLPVASASPSAAPLIHRPPSSTLRKADVFIGASRKALFYIAFLAHPVSPVDAELLARTCSALGREAERRQRESTATDEAVRIRKEEKAQQNALSSRAAPKIVEIP